MHCAPMIEYFNFHSPFNSAFFSFVRFCRSHTHTQSIRGEKTTQSDVLRHLTFSFRCNFTDFIHSLLCVVFSPCLLFTSTFFLLLLLLLRLQREIREFSSAKLISNISISVYFSIQQKMCFFCVSALFNVMAR